MPACPGPGHLVGRTASPRLRSHPSQKEYRSPCIAVPASSWSPPCWVCLSLVAAAPSAASLAAPTPDTTSNGVPLPAFHWTAVAGAAQYQFQLSAASDFSGTLMDASTKNTYYTMLKTVPDCSCFWRVRAVTTAGAAGPWSSVVE